EKPILVIPHARIATDVYHRGSDPQEMLDKLEHHALLDRIPERQLNSDLEHVLAEEGHPGGAVGLFQVAARRQGGAAIEDADVVQPQEAAFKDVAPVAVLAVDPPGEVHEQLLEGMCQPAAGTLSLRPFIQVVSKNRG